MKRKKITQSLAGSGPAPDPIASALADLPDGVAAKWFKTPLVPAAVLVPLIERDDGISVLLTQRTEHLKDHPGQISFPGGRVEEIDNGPLNTALREVHEEIGIAPEFVAVAGYLQPMAVVTGFAVTRSSDSLNLASNCRWTESRWPRSSKYRSSFFSTMRISRGRRGTYAARPYRYSNTDISTTGSGAQRHT